MISSDVGAPKFERTKVIIVAPTADVIGGTTTVGFRMREKGSFCMRLCENGPNSLIRLAVRRAGAVQPNFGSAHAKTHS